MEKFFKFTLPIICFFSGIVAVFVGIAMDESDRVLTTWPVYAYGIGGIVYFVAAWAMGWFNKGYKK